MRKVEFTWHARERYVERINPDLCIEEVENKIFTQAIRRQVETIRDGVIPLSNCYLIVKDYAVLTVYPPQKMSMKEKKRIHRKIYG